MFHGMEPPQPRTAGARALVFVPPFSSAHPSPDTPRRRRSVPHPRHWSLRWPEGCPPSCPCFLHFGARNKKMPASSDLILKTVVPAVGTVVCFFLYLAPARAVLAARRRGCLGVSVESVERWVSFFFRPSLFFRGGGGLRRWHTPPLPSMPSGSEGGLRGHGAAWRLRRPFGDRARATLHARAFFLVVRGARLGGGQRASFNPFLPHPQRPTRTSTPSPWSPCWPTRE